MYDEKVHSLRVARARYWINHTIGRRKIEALTVAIDRRVAIAEARNRRERVMFEEGPISYAEDYLD